MRRSKSPNFLLRLSFAFPLLFGGLVTLGWVESTYVDASAAVAVCSEDTGRSESTGVHSEDDTTAKGGSSKEPSRETPNAPDSAEFSDAAIVVASAAVVGAGEALEDEFASLTPSSDVVDRISPELLLSRPPPDIGGPLLSPSSVRAAESLRTLRSPRAPPRA